MSLAGLAPLAVAPRIKTLRICDFRAFPGPEPFDFDLDGKNLLIYGENGSGKSSIFHALDELFSVRLRTPADYRARFASLRNRFSGLSPADGFIEVTFDDGPPAARWSDAGHPVDVNPTADARVVNAAYRKAILDYRSLLETNYRHVDGPVNLFEVCVRVLLRDYPAVHDGKQERLFDLWKRLEGYAHHARTRVHPHLRQTEIDEVNVLAASFNQALQEALDALMPVVGPFLTDLGYSDLTLISLTAPGVTYDNRRLKTDTEFAGREVAVGLTFQGETLQAPQTFLNEARLSALALAIYFAGRRLCAATLQADTPRLMVLDDVLIGLDQSNRLPVLQVLQKHFGDWQVVLLTHDRVWFEMARLVLEDSAAWTSLEIFEEIEPGGASRPVLRPQGIDAVASNIATARTFLAGHQYPAAAVHARVAFEVALKKVCERKSIPVRFQTDPRKVDTNDLLTAVEKWLTTPALAATKALVDPAIGDIKTWRKVVLNPFSHSTPVSLTSGEVTAAVNAVEALHIAFRTRIT